MDNDKNLPEIPPKIMNTFNWAAAGFFGVLLLYFYQFNGSLGDQEMFGQFGDFIGGTLNPFLSFLTIVLLIWSIRLQMSELALTREEMKKSTAALEESATQQTKLLALQRQTEIRREIEDNLKFHYEKYQHLIDQEVIPNRQMNLVKYYSVSQALDVVKNNKPSLKAAHLFVEKLGAGNVAFPTETTEHFANIMNEVTFIAHATHDLLDHIQTRTVRNSHYSRCSKILEGLKFFAFSKGPATDFSKRLDEKFNAETKKA